MLGTTSATTSYGAKYPRWTNNQVAFQGFVDPDKVYPENAQPNITVLTWAFGAELDCKSLNSSQYNHSTPSGSGYGLMQLSAIDRGCEWSASLMTSPLYSMYLQTQTSVNCPSYNGSSGSGRLIVLGARSPVTFDHMTVLSCIPQYTKRQATLTLSLTGVNDHSIVDVQLNESTKEILQPDWWNSFESQLSQVTIRDSTQTAGQAASTNFLGRLILDNTRMVHTGNAWDANSLIGSSMTVYSAAYATLLVSQLTKPATMSTILNGSLATTDNRVSIVDFVAAFIVGAFVVATGNLVQIWLYTRKHHSVLREELDGLVAYGGILFGSIVLEDVEAARQDTTFDGQTTKFVKRYFNRNNLSRHLYQMENVDSLPDAHIIRR